MQDRLRLNFSRLPNSSSLSVNCTKNSFTAAQRLKVKVAQAIFEKVKKVHLPVLTASEASSAYHHELRVDDRVSRLLHPDDSGTCSGKRVLERLPSEDTSVSLNAFRAEPFKGTLEARGQQKPSPDRKPPLHGLAMAHHGSGARRELQVPGSHTKSNR